MCISKNEKYGLGRVTVMKFDEFKALQIINKKFELILMGRAKAYSSSCSQAVTHRSTNRARRRVTLF